MASNKMLPKNDSEVEKMLPFPLLGFDSDNGGEFLNHDLLRYFAD
jgi:hypothetical protein